MLRTLRSKGWDQSPVDIRSGFDVRTSKGRHMVMEIIKSVDHGQICRTYKTSKGLEKRKCYYIPMVEFVASIAR